jgi:hypothetical protein
MDLKMLNYWCPVEKVFTKKDYFNKHLDSSHSEMKLMIAEKPVGRKRRPKGHRASKEKLAYLCKRGKDLSLSVDLWLRRPNLKKPS